MKSLFARMLPDSARARAKRLVPASLVRLRRLWVLQNQRRHFERMTPTEAFSEIYRDRMWGRGSGSGSTSEHAIRYAEAVVSYARREGINGVVDIGCGDFVIGRKLVESGLGYVGVDVVPDLIRSHKQQFERDGVSFKCVDVIREPLPAGELCLIRQVLQHLSNQEISRILTNCRDYRRILITEHLPTGAGVVPNRDKSHGPDTRLDLTPRSGVFLEHPPFSVPTKTLFEVPYKESEILRTVVVENDRG